MTQPINLKENFFSPVGRLLWPSIVKTTHDLSNNECWSCGLELTEAESASMLMVVEAQLAEARRSIPGFPKTDRFKDSRGREDFVNLPYRPAMVKDGDQKVPKDGYLVWSFKRKTLTKRGDKATAPVILGPNGQLVQNPPDIGHSSIGRLVYRVFAYDNASKGVGFYLLGAQISSLATQELSGADAIDGDWNPDAPPVERSELPAAPAAAWNQNINDNFNDDEVPF